MKDEAGRILFFRFYDPRVLRIYLPTCTPEETKVFFGPVERYCVEGEEDDLMLELSSGREGLVESLVHLER